MDKDYVARSHASKNEQLLNSALVSAKSNQYMIPLINKTGSVTVKGSLVSASTTTDLAFQLQANQFDTIGVVSESGIADGQLAYIIIQGIADILLENNTSSTRGNFIFSSTVDGRANASLSVPDGGTIQSINEHFKEIGHCIESKSAGTNVLCKAIIHFN